MYSPGNCFNIIANAGPVSVPRIRSYATLYTCYIFTRYQAGRAWERLHKYTNHDEWRGHLEDSLLDKEARELAFAHALHDLERPRAGERGNEWRKRRKNYQRMAEIIRRHWNESEGLFTWGRTTYGP